MWVWTTLAALGGIGVVGVALWQVPWWLDAHYLPSITQPQATAITGVRTALLAMGAGGLAVVGILYTHRTLHQNREGQVTDRYSKAIGQIASVKLVEQLGGIYALERIMRDSAKDHLTIVEVLAAFVREHAPAPVQVSTHERLRLARRRLRSGVPVASALNGRTGAQTVDPRPTEPVQAALTVLARRPPGRDEPWSVNLTRTDLRGAHLHRARLETALLHMARLETALLRRAQMERAYLRQARLEGANLVDAHLEKADLDEAHLEGAILRRAQLDGASLRAADLKGASLRGAQLDGADLYHAHLDGADLDMANLNKAANLTVEQLVTARPTQRTRLPPHLAADARVMARIDAVEKGEEP